MGLAVLLGLAAAIACAAPGDGADPDEWVGSITTEGDVTAVVNESGSVWGGTAMLVEDLSIGVELGEDPYMFGYVGGVWATDERIYVSDSNVPAVRAYDMDGNHLFDIGGEGQGPGEYQSPTDLLVSPDGLLYVRDVAMGGPINIYTQDGEHVETLRGDAMLSSAWPMVLTRDGKLYTPAMNDNYEERGRWPAMGLAGRDGVGERLDVPMVESEVPSVRVNERFTLSVPFGPRFTWAMSPSGAMVVGAPGEYEFEIHHPDGRRTVVQRIWEREAVHPDEKEWERRATIRSGRRRGAEAWNWDGAEIPATKPAYSSVRVDADGRFWVARRGPSYRVEDCDEDPLDVTEGSPRRCWQYDILFDLFDEDGRLLSTAIQHPGLRSLLGVFIRGDTLIAPIEDDAGTIMVKRFRLVRPGGTAR